MLAMNRHLILTFFYLILFIPCLQAQTLNFGNGIDGIPTIGPNTVVNSYKKIQSVSGNTFTLAALIVEKQKELDRQKLVEAGFPEAAEVI